MFIEYLVAVGIAISGVLTGYWIDKNNPELTARQWMKTRKDHKTFVLINLYLPVAVMAILFLGYPGG